MTARREYLGRIITDSGVVRIGDAGSLRRHLHEHGATACISSDGPYPVYYYPGAQSRIVIELTGQQEAWLPDHQLREQLAKLDVQAQEGKR